MLHIHAKKFYYMENEFKQVVSNKMQKEVTEAVSGNNMLLNSENYLVAPQSQY